MTDFSALPSEYWDENEHVYDYVCDEKGNLTDDGKKIIAFIAWDIEQKELALKNYRQNLELEAREAEKEIADKINFALPHLLNFMKRNNFSNVLLKSSGFKKHLNTFKADLLLEYNVDLRVIPFLGEEFYRKVKE